MINGRSRALFPYLLIFYIVVIFLSNDMYLPAMPAMGLDLALNQEQVQSTLTFWFLGASSLQLIVGPISERYSRKNVTIIGAVLFMVSSLICAITSNLNILLAARLVQGTAVCSALVAGYAAIHALYDTKTAIKILTLINAVTIVAPALGPLGGALISEFYSWRYIFWLLFILAVVSVVLLIFVMPETNLKKHPMRISTILKNYKSIFSNLIFMAFNFSDAFLVAAFFTWMFESPFIFIEVYKKSGLFYGISQTFIFSGFFIGFAINKYMLAKYQLRKLINTAAIILIIGCVFMVFAVYFKFYELYLAILGMLIVSTGSAMLSGPVNRLAIDSAPEQPMGNRTAVFSAVVSIFGVIVGVVLAIIRSESLVAMSGLIIVCVIIALAMLFYAGKRSGFNFIDEIKN